MMPEKTIASGITGMTDVHIWLATITAMLGGIVSYLRRIQQGMKHSWFSIAVHMLTSGFAGLMCWLGCIQFDVPGPLTAISTGLAGHMGAEFIKIVESKFRDRIGKGEYK